MIGLAPVANAGDDKPWICHPVEGKGELGNGWNLINPSKASSHIDESAYPDGVYWKHETRDGRHDEYAVDGSCPAGPVDPPPTPTCETDPTLCPPPPTPTCETDPTLCPPVITPTPDPPILAPAPTVKHHHHPTSYAVPHTGA